MVIQSKKLKELDFILNKEDNFRVKEAIRSLRSQEFFNGAIGLLVSFYDRCTDKSIKNLIRDFMNDLKDQAVRCEVVSEIKKKWKPGTINMLVSSCWQSGLDYSSYCSCMAKLFLTSDYVTSIECFTVIEVSVENLSREMKDEIICIISAGADYQLDEKAALTTELLNILS